MRFIILMILILYRKALGVWLCLSINILIDWLGLSENRVLSNWFIKCVKETIGILLTCIIWIWVFMLSLLWLLLNWLGIWIEILLIIWIPICLIILLLLLIWILIKLLMIIIIIIQCILKFIIESYIIETISLFQLLICLRLLLELIEIILSCINLNLLWSLILLYSFILVHIISSLIFIVILFR